MAVALHYRRVPHAEGQVRGEARSIVRAVGGRLVLSRGPDGRRIAARGLDQGRCHTRVPQRGAVQRAPTRSSSGTTSPTRQPWKRSSELAVCRLPWVITFVRCFRFPALVTCGRFSRNLLMPGCRRRESVSTEPRARRSRQLRGVGADRRVRARRLDVPAPPRRRSRLFGTADAGRRRGSRRGLRLRPGGFRPGGATLPSQHRRGRNDSARLPRRLAAHRRLLPAFPLTRPHVPSDDAGATARAAGWSTGREDTPAAGPGLRRALRSAGVPAVTMSFSAPTVSTTA